MRRSPAASGAAGSSRGRSRSWPRHRGRGGRWRCWCDRVALGARTASTSLARRCSMIRRPRSSSQAWANSTVASSSRLSPTAMLRGPPPTRSSAGARRVPRSTMSTSASPATTIIGRSSDDHHGITRGSSGAAQCSDVRVGRELVEVVIGVDRADGPAARTHHQGVRGGPATVVAHPLHQLTVGDPGGDEEAVVAGDEVVGLQDLVEVVARGHARAPSRRGPAATADPG